MFWKLAPLVLWHLLPNERCWSRRTSCEVVFPMIQIQTKLQSSSQECRFWKSFCWYCCWSYCYLFSCYCYLGWYWSHFLLHTYPWNHSVLLRHYRYRTWNVEKHSYGFCQTILCSLAHEFLPRIVLYSYKHHVCETHQRSEQKSDFVGLSAIWFLCCFVG